MLIVGAGPAGLACAIRFGQLLEEHPDVAEQLGEVPLAVVEKGKQTGSHLLSGAVVNPRSLQTLFGAGFQLDRHPQLRAGARRGRSTCSPARPPCASPPRPPMRNHGNVIVSLSQLGPLAGRAGRGGRRHGPARDGRARSCWSRTAGWSGVRTGDKGRGPDR